MDFKPITMLSGKSDCAYWLIQCPWSKLRGCDYSALLCLSRLALVHLVYLHWYEYGFFIGEKQLKYEDFINVHKVEIDCDNFFD